MQLWPDGPYRCRIGYRFCLRKGAGILERARVYASWLASLDFIRRCSALQGDSEWYDAITLPATATSPRRVCHRTFSSAAVTSYRYLIAMSRSMSVAIFFKASAWLKNAFVLPPATSDGQKVIPSHHPIMTATLAAVAVEEGAHVGVIDAALLGLGCEDLAQLILEWGAQWVGFVPFEYRRELPLDTVLKTAEAIRRVNDNIQLGVLNASWGALSPRRAVEQNQLSFASFGDGEPAIRSFAKMEKPARGVLWNISGYLEDNPSRPVVSVGSITGSCMVSFLSILRIDPPHIVIVYCPRCLFLQVGHVPMVVISVHSLCLTLLKNILRAPEQVYREEKHWSLGIIFESLNFMIQRSASAGKTFLFCVKSYKVWGCLGRAIRDVIPLMRVLIEAMARSGCHTILFWS